MWLYSLFKFNEMLKNEPKYTAKATQDVCNAKKLNII